MKICYITKFALEQGILEGTLVGSCIYEDGYTHQKENRYLIKTEEHTYSLRREDFEYHREKAVKKAEHVRDEEIRKLEARLKELRQMEFSKI